MEHADDLEGTKYRRDQLLARIAATQIKIIKAVTATNFYSNRSGYVARSKISTAVKEVAELQRLSQELHDFDDRYPNPRFVLLTEKKEQP